MVGKVLISNRPSHGNQAVDDELNRKGRQKHPQQARDDIDTGLTDQFFQNASCNKQDENTGDNDGHDADDCQ